MSAINKLNIDKEMGSDYMILPERRVQRIF